MSCSCNASAVRLFARGLVQVHRLEPGPSFALPIRGASSSGGARFAGGGVVALAPHHRRSLHASSRALGDAESPAPVNSSLEEQQPTSAPESSSSPPTEPTPRQPAAASVDAAGGRTRPREDSTAEARSRAAWRFKQQGFDWKAFRSKDPAVRAKANLSNFDWEHWQGKKQGSRKLSQLVDNLEAARAEDRAAVGITPREGGIVVEDQRRRRAASPTTAAASRHTETPSGHDGMLPPPPPRKKEEWMLQKEAAKAKFPDGWKPHKRLSPDALAGIRALNAQFPDVYTTQALADRFAVSPEAIRRILKSKWTPSAREDEDRQGRWHRRGVDVWARKAELGIKPPRRWRDEGVAREPAYHERKAAARQGRADQVRRERDEYMRSFAKGGSGEDEAVGSVVDGASGGDRRRGCDDEGKTRSTGDKRWGARRGGPGSGRRQTENQADQDIFDQALASERRE